MIRECRCSSSRGSRGGVVAVPPPLRGRGPVEKSFAIGRANLHVAIRFGIGEMVPSCRRRIRGGVRSSLPLVNPRPDCRFRGRHLRRRFSRVLRTSRIERNCCADSAIPNGRGINYYDLLLSIFIDFFVGFVSV